MSLKIIDMKVLHLTFHSGTINEIKYISKYFGFEITSQRFDDGQKHNINNVNTEKLDIKELSHTKSKKIKNNSELNAF
jgi:hypothetical protein